MKKVETPLDLRIETFVNSSKNGEMRSRSPRQFKGYVLGDARIVCGKLGRFAADRSVGAASFVCETWNGTVTITRTRQPDVSWPTAAAFEVVLQTNRWKLQVSIRRETSRSRRQMTAVLEPLAITRDWQSCEQAS
jgi:hypothetical protein